MSEGVAGHLASRAKRAIKPALSYFKAFIEAKDRQWSPEDPGGNIILSVAENKISASLVHVSHLAARTLHAAQIRMHDCMHAMIKQTLGRTKACMRNERPLHVNICMAAGATRSGQAVPARSTVLPGSGALPRLM